MSNFKHGKRKHPLYTTWTNMKTRCTNKNIDGYQYYGGKGVSVCQEWNCDFRAFYEFAIKNGWKRGLEIDRIDTDGDYTPENCRFVTQVANSCTRLRRVDNKTGYIGVSWHKGNAKYVARITVDKKVVSLGYYNTSREAAIKRDSYIKANNLNHTLNFKDGE